MNGIAKLLLSPHHGPVNLGNPDEMSILELAEMIVRLTKSRSKIIFEKLPQDDPKVRQPDIQRAKKLLKWAPTVELEVGLAKTISYFRKALQIQ